MVIGLSESNSVCNHTSDNKTGRPRSRSPICLSRIDHIHNNRHVGFDIIMQISHVVCQGANIKMMLFLRKSAGLNSEVSAPKSHLRAKM